MNLTQVVNELRDEQRNAANHAQQLGTVIRALETLAGGPRRTPAITARTPGSTNRGIHAAPPNATKHTLSPAGRKAIARAQKARWAKSRLAVVGKKAA
jgi:hypothetical protein